MQALKDGKQIQIRRDIVLHRAFSIALDYLVTTDLLLVAKTDGKKGEMRRATKEEWAKEIFDEIRDELNPTKGS